MYKEFGDKDGLFEGALDRYRGTVMAPRFAILAQSPDMAGVMAFLDSVAGGAAGQDYKGCLMMNHLAQKHAISAKAAAMIDDFCAAMESLLETALRNAQAAGDLPRDRDPALLASTLMCWVHGLVLYGRHPGRKAAILKLRDTIARTVLA
jgi:TetR/AcrR family transcriptional repressor of nem operon